MKKLLITDVDNTLFDWQTIWFKCFHAMTSRVLEISKVDAERFYEECSVIHQKHGTSEYAFILTELPCLQALYGDELLTHVRPAIDAFRETRRQYLKLYPDVLATLRFLKDSGVTIAAFTESKAFYTSYRFRALKLDGVIDFLYSPADHDIPFERSHIRKYEASTYDLQSTIHHLTPDGELKPSPQILSTIISELGFSKNDTVYVGDNKLKDVYMAQEAGVLDIYAAYGAAQHRTEQYDLLKKVTHWTPEMVARESEALKPGVIRPTHTLHHSFAEIKEIIR